MLDGHTQNVCVHVHCDVKANRFEGAVPVSALRGMPDLRVLSLYKNEELVVEADEDCAALLKELEAAVFD